MNPIDTCEQPMGEFRGAGASKSITAICLRKSPVMPPYLRFGGVWLLLRPKATRPKGKTNILLKTNF